MRRALALLPLTIASALLAVVAFPQHTPPAPAGPAVIHPDERHLRNLRQLTFGGENAEGYWSPDGTQIIYQHRNAAEGIARDQEFLLEVATGKSRRVSNGKGRTTCGYLYDGGRRVAGETNLFAVDWVD